MEDRVELKRMQTSTEELKKLLKELEARKSAGSDGKSKWVGDKCKQQIARKTERLINASLSQGKVLMDWEQANTVPIYKGGSEEDPLNYRPLS